MSKKRRLSIPIKEQCDTESNLKFVFRFIQDLAEQEVLFHKLVSVHLEAFLKVDLVVLALGNFFNQYSVIDYQTEKPVQIDNSADHPELESDSEEVGSIPQLIFLANLKLFLKKKIENLFCFDPLIAALS